MAYNNLNSVLETTSVTLIWVCIHANDCVFAELTLQLLSSSAVKMMVPHFFPGIPLEGRKKEGERELTATH